MFAASKSGQSVVAASSDPNFPYVPLLLETGPASSRSTTVTDSSSVPLTVTRNGTPSTGWVSPYQTNGYWGNLFSSASDGLTFAANAGFVLTGGAFTIEFWAYPTSGSNYDTIIDGGMGSGFGLTRRAGTNAIVWQAAGAQIEVGSTFLLNQWNHIVANYSGSGSVNLYINGTSVSSAGAVPTNTGTIALLIGKWSAGQPFAGYVSNVRIVKGSAVYTNGSTITVPTAPLTAVTNTQLLTCQANRFVDSNTQVTAKTLTVTGTPQVTPYFYPSTFTAPTASTGAGLFNGSTDYLNSPSSAALAVGTGQFTIEMWIYFNSLASAPNEIFATSTDGTSGKLVIYYAAGSLQVVASGGAGGTSASFTPITGQWYHIAASRDASNNQRLFVNGALLATATSTNNYSQNGFTLGRSGGGAGGNYTNGYIANLRLVVGTAVYTAAFTPPTTPVTAISGTSLLLNLADSNYVSATNGVQNNTFIDNSNYAFTITRSGTPTQGSVTPYWPNGYWSNYFNGSSALTTATTAALDLTSGDWTIQGYYFPTSYSASNNVISYIGSAVGNKIVIATIGTAGNLYYLLNGSVTISSATAAPLNAWSFFALVKSGATTTLYLNGVSLGTTASVPTTSNKSLYLGSDNGSSPYQGYISNFRVLKGTALTTIPTSPLTPIANTSLLICQSNRFLDNGTANGGLPFPLTTVGTPTVQAFQPFSPTASYTTAAYGGSGYFNGSTDYLTAPNNAALALGSGDFTVEFWAYLSSTSGAYFAIDSRNAGADAGFAILFETSSGYNVRVYRNGAYLLTSSATVAANTWYHVAFVRSGATSYLYLNGVQVASAADSNTYVEPGTFKIANGWNFGNPFPGYLSNIRVVKGVAVYTGAFTPPTLAPLATTGPTSAASYSSTTNVNTTFLAPASLLTNFTNAGIYDAAVQNNALTVGSAQASTTISPKWGVTSMKFNGTTDYLSIPSGPANFGTGDFTIEGWVNFTSAGGGYPQFLSAGGAAFPQFAFTSNTQIYFYDGTTTYAGSFTFTFGTWYYVAWTRGSGVLKIYVNGTQLLSTSYTGAVNLNTAFVGAYSNGLANGFLNGYIQDLRITRGIARTITTPTAAFPTR